MFDLPRRNLYKNVDKTHQLKLDKQVFEKNAKNF